MRVKLLIHWNGNEAGSVLDLEPPIADLLLERGAAVKVEDKQQQKIQPTEIKKKK